MSQVETIELLSQQPPSKAFLRKFTDQDLRAYITVALTYKSEEYLSQLFLRAHLDILYHDRQRYFCANASSAYWEKADNERVRDSCRDAVDADQQISVSAVRKEVWEEKTRYIKDGWKLLAQPQRGFRQLSKSDHDRVKFFIAARTAYEHGNIGQMFKLLAMRVPFIAAFMAIDVNKVSKLLIRLSRSDLMMVSSMLDLVLLTGDRFASWKLSFSIRNRVLDRIRQIQNLMHGVSDSVITSSINHISKLQGACFEDLITALRTCCHDKYLNEFVSRGGGFASNIGRRLKSTGSVILLFFSTMFSLVFIILSLPVFIIKDSHQCYVTRKRLSDTPKVFHEKSLECVWASMLNRMNTHLKWLPNHMMKATGEKIDRVQHKIKMQNKDEENNEKLENAGMLLPS